MLGDEIEKIPLRHERYKSAGGRQVGEIGHGVPFIADHAAEITKKVGMLLKNHDFDTGAGQKKAEHHAGGPAARDAALGAKDLRIAVGHFLRDLSITLCRCS